MAKSKKQGMRIYRHLTPNTAWTALAAGAAPGTGWLQVAGGVNAKVTPAEVDRYDIAPLEATTKQPARDLNPGNITFTIDQDDVSVALRQAAVDGTKATYAVLYLNGQADVVTGRLVCTDGGSADKGDFKAYVQESYQIDGDGVVLRYDHA